jgi:multidrug efflux pump subunit AcrA (membrane-fusion protein)
LVGRVVQSGQPLIYCGERGDLSPQVESALGHYLDGTATRELVVAPALPPSTTESPTPSPHVCQVAMVAEQFTGRLPLEWLARIQTVSEHAALALSRARALRRVQFLFGSNPANLATPWPISRRSTMLLAMFLTMAVTGLLLAYVPADFRIVAHGRLQPLVREWVFAPADGVVHELAVDHGQLVTKGAPLLTLRSTELELEIQQVAGQLETARQELAMLDTAKLQHAAANASADLEASDLMSKQLAVEERIRNLESQLRILQAKKASLVVASPIAGTVLNWQPAHYLRARPVERGAALLEIGDLSGQWVVDLDVADHRAGHVLKALESPAGDAPTAVPVSFIVATNPAKSFAGTIVRVAQTTHLDEHGESAVRMEVAFDQNQLPERRHGAAVVAKIDCGRRSLGFVWFHELLEELERRFF